jgi:hypothetical protein
MADSVLHKQYFCNSRCIYGIKWEDDPVDKRGYDLLQVPSQHLLAGTEKNKKQLIIIVNLLAVK